MFVAGEDGQLMLTGLCRDLEIVPRNWMNRHGEFAAKRCVIPSGGAIDRQRRKFPFDQAKPLLVTRTMTRSEDTKPKFAKDNRRNEPFLNSRRQKIGS